MNSLDQHQLLEVIHSKTDLTPYLDVIFSAETIGSERFIDFANQCFSNTATKISGFKKLRRYERLLRLLKFQQFSLEHSAGDLVECGVLRGASAMALARNRDLIKNDSLSPPKLWLIDSFEGLSAPTAEDLVEISKNGETKKYHPMGAGHFATPKAIVENNLDGLTNVNFVQGWIPSAFSQLPDISWSFVHIDVDLYLPVAACLDYFYPRLAKNGVIVNDDFSSILFPGAGKAWHEFFEAKKRGYAILDTGQAVFINC